MLHIATWEAVVRRRARGEKVEVSDAEDWPKVTETTQKAWEAALERLESGHRELVRVVAAFDERRLDAPLVPGGNSGYVQFHGVAQHDLYHAGQIAVLKKG